MESLEAAVKATIRDIPDFPKPGILFKDITPVLADPALFQRVIDHLAARYADQKIDVVVGMESRGFLFGAPLALALKAAFAPARKPGKLPYESISVSYDLEYGSATLELHTDAITAGQRVLVVDDLLATGGTAKATAALIDQLGGEVVEFAFLVDLAFLGGSAVLPARTHAIATY